MKVIDRTVYVIFTDPRTFPKSPAYEGTDITEAARVAREAGDAKKSVAMRVRWRGKISCGLSHEMLALANEIKRQRRQG